jgi:hypothetical protein
MHPLAQSVCVKAFDLVRREASVDVGDDQAPPAGPEIQLLLKDDPSPVADVRPSKSHQTTVPTRSTSFADGH